MEGSARNPGGLPLQGGNHVPPKGARTAAGARTNLPQWSATPPEPDLAGRGFVVASIGVAGQEVAAGWASVIKAQGAPLRWLRSAGSADELATDFSAVLEAARVGVRLMLAAPEIDVLALNALALEAGMMPCEIRMHATANNARRVRCAHCATVFTATVEALGGVRCAGCGLDLLVQHHLSRHRGAYQGYWTRLAVPRPPT